MDGASSLAVGDEKARENVARYHQKPTSHAESWYGFYSAFLAARYFRIKHWINN